MNPPVMTLGVLCQGIVPLSGDALKGVSITGIASDSRRVEPGNLFVAVPGQTVDGHAFLEEAVRRGAGAVVVEREMGETAVPVIRVERTRKVLSFFARRYFENASDNLLLVGVTGTNGKTTVAFLIESILGYSGLETGLLGTVSYRWKNHDESAKLTTPDILDIHRLFWQMQGDGVRAVVMEVSSHALALDRVLGLEFEGAVFTNLSRDHFDFHPSLQDYAETKAKLFRMLKPEGVGVVNGDDPAGEVMFRAARGKKVTYGERKPVDYCIEGVEEAGDETRFMVRGRERKLLLAIRLWGRFNVMNATAAAVLGLELGLDERAIREGIRAVDRVRGRMEGFDSGRGFRVVVDYAHTPDALQNVLQAVREFTSGRVLVVFGCGGDRDRGKRPEMGKIAASLTDVVFVTSDNPRSEDPETILADILTGIERREKVEKVADRKEAIHRALDTAREGDTVVIAGKGHETYQQVGSERIPFDDRAVAEAHLGFSGEG